VGTDYNVLIAARLREELRGDPGSAGAVAAAVRHVAPAIVAAGLVLAASFATLVLAPDPGTRETGFALAVGILIAALVVSSVLVPSLAALSVHRRDAPRPQSTTEGAVP
jgi:RND superfamily putative drug exporter